jgi:hypothetical protein
MKTLKDARTLCAPIAMAGGACSSASVLDQRINEALTRLAELTDLTEMTSLIHLISRGNTVSLPYGYRAARLIDVGLNPTRLRHVGYEFSTSGPGQEPECSCGSLSLIREPGFYPTFFDIPKGRELSVAAFLPKDDRNARYIRVQGRLANGEVLHDGEREGKLLRVNVWKDGIEGEIVAQELQTLGPIAEISRLILPARSQYLTLLALDLETYETYFLGKYHPDDTNPGFARYRIRGATFTEEHAVSCLVKSDVQEVKYADDILPIQNLNALKQMVMGIREENARNLNEAQVFFQMAENLLLTKADDDTRGEEVMLPIKDDYGYGGGSLSL